MEIFVNYYFIVEFKLKSQKNELTHCMKLAAFMVYVTCAMPMKICTGNVPPVGTLQAMHFPSLASKKKKEIKKEYKILAYVIYDNYLNINYTSLKCYKKNAINNSISKLFSY